MKKHILFFVIAFSLISKIGVCDVIPSNSHYVQKCVKITNLEDYPEVSLIGFMLPSPTGSDNYLITSTKCLTRGYYFDYFNVFAVKKEYLIGKNIQKLDFTKDPNALPSNISIEPSGGYFDNSNPISSIEQYYKIIGFSETSVILLKWKEVNKFNNGKPDSTSTYTYNGELSKLYQTIPTNINSNLYYSSIEIYPNPAQKNLHLKLTNKYLGNIPVEITTITGKKLKSININKTGTVIDQDIRIENLATGTYIVYVRIGNKTESKKVIIK